jgi:hypothetical protein
MIQTASQRKIRKENPSGRKKNQRTNNQRKVQPAISPLFQYMLKKTIKVTYPSRLSRLSHPSSRLSRLSHPSSRLSRLSHPSIQRLILTHPIKKVIKSKIRYRKLKIYLNLNKAKICLSNTVTLVMSPTKANTKI